MVDMSTLSYRTLTGDKDILSYESISRGSFTECYMSGQKVYCATDVLDTSKAILSQMRHKNLPLYVCVGTMGGYPLYECPRYLFGAPDADAAYIRGELCRINTSSPFSGRFEIPDDIMSALRMVEPYVAMWDFKFDNLAFNGRDIILLDVFVGKN